MKFTLHYRRATAGQRQFRESKEASKNKHDIRECLRLQLDDLWGREPLFGQNPSLLNPEYGSRNLVSKKPVMWNFASIVNANLGLVAELRHSVPSAGRTGRLNRRRRRYR